jgi:hypothetical protein
MPNRTEAKAGNLSRSVASPHSGTQPVDAVCLYQPHPVFSPPEDENATIWRYLDFTKLVSLLDTKQLYFARVDTFDDAFEGSISAATREYRRQAYADPKLSEDENEERIRYLTDHTRSAPSWMYANCWSLSEVESAALWGLYVQADSGVAVRSTYRQLIDSFISPDLERNGPNVAPLLVGKVAYVDYDEFVIPDDNSFYPFVHKRKSFEFESELRAMTWHMPSRISNEPNPIGLRVNVDLATLFNAIHVSPSAPPWFAALVQSVVDRYNFSAPVVQSRLSGEPLY